MAGRVSVAKAWEGFEQIVLSGASEIQKQEMRKAFYAGAAWLFQAIMIAMDPGEDPTDDDLRMMDELNNELMAFVAGLDESVFAHMRTKQ